MDYCVITSVVLLHVTADFVWSTLETAWKFAATAQYTVPDNNA